jgi:hypothetical protein
MKNARGTHRNKSTSEDDTVSMSTTFVLGKTLKPKIKLSIGRVASSAAAGPGPGSTGTATATANINRQRDAVPVTASKHEAAASVGTGVSVERGQLEKILSKIQAKDSRKIFCKPVTEALVRGWGKPGGREMTGMIEESKSLSKKKFAIQIAEG